MSYNTCFHLYVFRNVSTMQDSELCEELSNRIKGDKDISFFLEDYNSRKHPYAKISEFHFGPAGEGSWRDYDAEICKLSLEYPNVILKLHGEGEEAGDIWDAYYLNGRSVRYNAIIEIPSLDITDLL